MDVLPGDAHVLAGEHYYVKLIGQNTDNGLAQEVAWDNIRLNGPVSTPEPGTLAILASGLIGLVCYAWRKRK
jgi:sorbitol-specific phosphotransferase system component IIA